ncbi:MAG TPA: YtxH domain-containing protein [Longimicrobiales bacterium]|nr:YtxH domain-containing protein [Longimicrobiales bacterium]
MRDQDEVPYIVIDRGGGSGLGSFVLGALIGAGVALLLAPKTGEETQEDLKEGARKLKAAAEVRVREAQQQLEERLEAAREGVQSRVEEVKEAVEAGRKAAVDARGELEERLHRSKAAYRAGVDAARHVVTAGAEAGEEEDG